MVIQPQYEDAGDFYNGMAWIYERGYIGYIDSNNNQVISPKYDYIDEDYACNFFDDGYAAVNYGGYYGVIDKEGNTVIEPYFNFIYYINYK